MLEFLGEQPAADLIMSGIAAVTQEGQTLTPDLGGRATTVEMVSAVREKMLAV
jgi:tartrate dehydrogenase/decarboxylase / D-malate dehydrogenase